MAMAMAAPSAPDLLGVSALHQFQAAMDSAVAAGLASQLQGLAPGAADGQSIAVARDAAAEASTSSGGRGRGVGRGRGRVVAEEGLEAGMVSPGRGRTVGGRGRGGTGASAAGSGKRALRQAHEAEEHATEAAPTKVGWCGRYLQPPDSGQGQ